MSDPNPYTPPQVPDSLTTTKVVKRGVGLVVLLLLTPVAVVITGGISCLAGARYFEAHSHDPDAYDPLAIGLVIFLVPPLFVLVSMLGWAGFKFVDWIKSRRVVVTDDGNRRQSNP
jgi:hypothetical protein